MSFAEAAVTGGHFIANNFQAWSEEIPPALVLHVAGEIDLMTAPSLQLHLTQLIGRDCPIIVDCSELQYLDMAGVHVLEVCHRQAEQSGQRLVLVGSTPLVHKILVIVRLDQRVPLVDTLGEALEAVGQVETGV